ncbi:MULTISPECIES: DUF6137 domain-containing protein [Streptomyces]|uniref:Uncharacterized protein n=1 Tax=Streptomyces xinghaiensis S187 TaxID=1038929 RepID=K9L7C3_9ACTN|nr:MULTISPECIES: DUF6137 domain-containing protein [Streptomyces]AFD33540.1 hypothetical protein [Streptomyces xinghaiensis S187]MCC3650691.1 hypothetical protein [Streptomyces sp. S07_1.15]MCC9738423.1 hypothetical protein [Streptomyces sp. MNU89]MZE77555.1 hypothetical protein [Streptomyces sp. SID5475]
MTRMLVLKCLSDETGDDAGDIVAQGFVDVDDREFLNIVNRLEGYFDCTLSLRSRPGRRLVVQDLVELVTEATGHGPREVRHG